MGLCSPPSYERRIDQLRRSLSELDHLVVAFSGGVDSAVLLHVAVGVLGRRAIGVVADSPSLPRAELDDACRLARDMGAPLHVLQTDELSDPRYTANTGNRCYFCKRTLFVAMGAWAAEMGYTQLAFGEIVDDLADDRPGALAASELRVSAPLREAGLTKEDVRRYATEVRLAVADKPASACLASRIPVGRRVTRERLARVEAAEARVRALGFRVLRVRDHGDVARVEVGGSELKRAGALRDTLTTELAEVGFARVEIDAYRQLRVVNAERSAAGLRGASARGS